MLSDVKIRELTRADQDAAVVVINTAAQWYQEFLSAEEYHDPEMTSAQWQAEAKRLTWYGAFQAEVLAEASAEASTEVSPEVLLGVMGLEYVQDVALLRHAYILPEQQRHGIGSRLREHLENQIRGVERQGVARIIVGTYTGNYKARAALEGAGYQVSADSEAVLRAYYAIPKDRLQSSVTYEKVIEEPSLRPLEGARPNQTLV